MKRISGWLVLSTAVLVLGCYGQGFAGTKTVGVTVTNLTSHQHFSPPQCVTHDSTFALYELGQPASTALESIAEDAVDSDLQDLVATEAGAKSLVGGSGVIPPGGTATIFVEMAKKDLVSCIWMLVNTNDTFAGIGAVARPDKKKPVELHPMALDAGTEVNDEQAVHIPGPCCGDTGRNGTDEGGVVLGSPGIDGQIGDLTHMYDWRGAVAKVKVAR